MATITHHSSEGGRVLMIVAAAVVFVILGLTWLPEMMSTSEQGGSDVGRTVKMIK